MANIISKIKGKLATPYDRITQDPNVTALNASPLVNKGWRALIIVNRVTSPLPKDVHPEGDAYSVNNGSNIYGPRSTANPSFNGKARKEWETKLKSGNPAMDKDTSDSNEQAEIIISRQPLQRHEEHKRLSYGKNKVIIYNLTSNGGYEFIEIQNRPSELDFKGETTWAAIKSMGRNLPMYHYTGAEDRIQFNISWFCNDPKNPGEVLAKCRLLESWSKANAYIAAPPILRIQWGDSNIFDNHKYVLASATYTLKNFQSGHKENGEFVNTKLYPAVATQELVFYRVADHNLGYGEILDEDLASKTNFGNEMEGDL